jgi:hypothetical protein
MAYTPIEIIAWIVIIASAIKMIVLLINPVSWMNFAKKLYAKPTIVKPVAFVLAGIILYYLLAEGITIVQIMAVTAFVASLLMIGLASEAPGLMKKFDVMIKKGNIWKEYWFYSLLWIILLIWAAKELLGL